jgi:hypothetical protein
MHICTSICLWKCGRVPGSLDGRDLHVYVLPVTEVVELLPTQYCIEILFIRGHCCGQFLGDFRQITAKKLAFFQKKKQCFHQFLS